MERGNDTSVFINFNDETLGLGFEIQELLLHENMTFGVEFLDENMETVASCVARNITVEKIICDSYVGPEMTRMDASGGTESRELSWTYKLNSKDPCGLSGWELFYSADADDLFSTENKIQGDFISPIKNQSAYIAIEAQNYTATLLDTLRSYWGVRPISCIGSLRGSPKSAEDPLCNTKPFYVESHPVTVPKTGNTLLRFVDQPFDFGIEWTNITGCDGTPNKNYAIIVVDEAKSEGHETSNYTTSMNIKTEGDHEIKWSVWTAYTQKPELNNSATVCVTPGASVVPEYTGDDGIITYNDSVKVKCVSTIPTVCTDSDFSIKTVAVAKKDQASWQNSSETEEAVLTLNAPGNVGANGVSFIVSCRVTMKSDDGVELTTAGNNKAEVVFCTREAPSVPTNLILKNHVERSTDLECTLGKEISLEFSWDAPSSWGSQCGSFVKNGYFFSSDYKDPLVYVETQNTYTIKYACDAIGSKTFNFNVFASNNLTNSSLSDTLQVSVCVNEAPSEPKNLRVTKDYLVEDNIMMLAWDASENKGFACSGDTLKYVVQVMQNSEIKNTTLVEGDVTELSVYNIEGSGSSETVKVTIYAQLGDMQSASVEKDFTLCRSVAPTITQKYDIPEFFAEDRVWNTTMNWTRDNGNVCVETMVYEMTLEYSYTVDKESGPVVESGTVTMQQSEAASGSVPIKFSKEILSTVNFTLKAFNGEKTTTNVAQVQTREHCVSQPPFWEEEEPITSPAADFVALKETVPLTVEWKPVKHWGLSCIPNSSTFYDVTVTKDGTTLVTTRLDGKEKSVELNTDSWTSGSLLLSLTAGNENKTMEKTKTFEYCRITSPQEPELEPYPHQFGLTSELIVTWKPIDWGESCRKNRILTLLWTADGKKTTSVQLNDPDQTSCKLKDLPTGEISVYLNAVVDNPLFISVNSAVKKYSICETTAPPQPTIVPVEWSYTTESFTPKWTYSAEDFAEYAKSTCLRDTAPQFDVTFQQATGTVTGESTTEEYSYTFTDVSVAFPQEYSVAARSPFGTSALATSKVYICVPTPLTSYDLELLAPESEAYVKTTEAVTLKFTETPEPSRLSCNSIDTTLVLWNETHKFEYGLLHGSTYQTFDKGFFVNQSRYCWKLVLSAPYSANVSKGESCFNACDEAVPPAVSKMEPETDNFERVAMERHTLVTKWDSDEWEMCGNTPGEYQFVINRVNSDETEGLYRASGFTAAKEYNVTDLDDGRYCWHVNTRSSGGTLVTEGPAKCVRVCYSRPPATPQQAAGATGNVMYRRSGVALDVLLQQNVGSNCDAAAGARAGYTFRVVDLSDLTATTTTLPLATEGVPNGESQMVVRLSPALGYGFYEWSVTVCNNDGECAASAETPFVVCDYPRVPRATAPADGATGVALDAAFAWADSSDVGYACRAAPAEDPSVRLYVDDATVDAATVPHTLVRTLRPSATGLPFASAGERVGLAYGRRYVWRLNVTNGDLFALSPVYTFATARFDCTVFGCAEGQGTCVAETGACACKGDWGGLRCDEYTRSEARASVAAVVVPVVVCALALAFAGVLVALFLVKRRRDQSRIKVALRAPGGDLRFTHVKAVAGVRAQDARALEETIVHDPEHGFAFALRVAGSAQSADAENVCKALLYAYEAHGLGLALVEAVISHEVAQATSATVLFRANTPATFLFKHYSKMVGLAYLFGVLSGPLRAIIQKALDDEATEKQVQANKAIGDLMLMPDTYEVDPTRLEKVDDGDFENEQLSIGSLQLRLMAAKFLASIFKSAASAPAGLRRVCAHISAEVSARFPEAEARVLGAFLFLRFYNCALAIPEAYGLLPDAPSPKVRRSLVLITKITTTLSAGASFGEKEEYMTQFNSLIADNAANVHNFYREFVAVDPGAPGAQQPDHTEIPPKLYADSLSVIADPQARHNKQVSSGPDGETSQPDDGDGAAPQPDDDAAAAPPSSPPEEMEVPAPKDDSPAQVSPESESSE